MAKKQTGQNPIERASLYAIAERTAERFKLPDNVQGEQRTTLRLAIADAFRRSAYGTPDGTERKLDVGELVSADRLRGMPEHWYHPARYILSAVEELEDAAEKFEALAKYHAEAWDESDDIYWTAQEQRAKAMVGAENCRYCAARLREAFAPAIATAERIEADERAAKSQGA